MKTKELFRYMFAVDRETLIRSLETMRRSMCHYGPDAETCDCKFASSTYPIGQGEVSGCAEIEQTIRFFSAMTPLEFDRIYKRQFGSLLPRKGRLPDKRMPRHGRNDEWTPPRYYCTICIPITEYASEFAWNQHIKQFHKEDKNA